MERRRITVRLSREAHDRLFELLRLAWGKEITAVVDAAINHLWNSVVVERREVTGMMPYHEPGRLFVAVAAEALQSESSDNGHTKPPQASDAAGNDPLEPQGSTAVHRGRRKAGRNGGRLASDAGANAAGTRSVENGPGRKKVGRGKKSERHAPSKNGKPAKRKPVRRK